MKIKTTPDGKHAILRNGVPVYIMDNGTEREIDGAAAWKLALGKHFETSPVMGGLKLPPDVAASFFGDSFRIAAGKLVAVDQHGIQLYSPTRHGEAADFNEAFAQLVDRYEGKGMIQREHATAKPGQHGQGTAITRAQFNALPQDSRAKFVREGGSIADGAAPAAAALAAVQRTGDGKAVSRAQFDAMGPLERAGHVKAGGLVTD